MSRTRLLDYRNALLPLVGMQPAHGKRDRSDEIGASMDVFVTLQALVPRLESFGERAAVVAFTKEAKTDWSYAKLSDAAARLATGLVKAGIDKGDVIALCAEDSPEWIAACLATIACGAVAAPLDVQLSDDALDHA